MDRWLPTLRSTSDYPGCAESSPQLQRVLLTLSNNRMLSTATAKGTRTRFLSVAVLLCLLVGSPVASLASSFVDLSPLCCHTHQIGGLAGLFAKHSCCCRRVAAHGSAPSIHSRSQCGSDCGHAPSGVGSTVNLAVAGLGFSLAPPPALEALAPSLWSAPLAQALALRRHQRPPPSFS